MAVRIDAWRPLAPGDSLGRPRTGRVARKIAAVAMIWSCALLLGGCMHATKSQSVQHYTLGNSTTAAETDRTAAALGGKILQISRIEVPSWLAGTAMYYRLDYRDDQALAAYAHSDWIAPPATLLEPLIQSTISAGGDWRAVIGPGNPASADASLHVRLADFSQAFSRLDDSASVIDVTATLVDNHDGRVIAQRHFHVETATPTPDARGGVKAMAEASRQFANDLQRWLARVSAPAH